MWIGRALIASRVRFYNSTRIPRYTMRFPAGPELVLPAMGVCCPCSPAATARSQSSTRRRCPLRQRRPDLFREGLGLVGVVVGVPRAKPETQAVSEVPGDDVQVQVGD
jgi:hypothetical protein